MDPVIKLSFHEWMVINELEKSFKKNDGYTVSIPSSRQQKGFDVILYNKISRKSVTVQIKSSRTYTPTSREFSNYTWFNSFPIEKGLSDYYILFGLYVKTPKGKVKRTKVKNQNWFDFVLLLFTEDEMWEFLSKLTLRNSDRKDTKFSFGFDNTKEIFLTRGSKETVDYSKYLLSKRFQEIVRVMK